MIVGNGMLANAFLSYKENRDVVVFASGVSNSLLSDQDSFDREERMLRESIAAYPLATFIYFGTCSVDDPELCNSAYVTHKKSMEAIVEKNAQHYFIFRLSQVVGKSSSPTLINFLVRKLKKHETFSIWKHSSRNLIDVDDVYKIAHHFIENNLFTNEITNIAAPFSLSIFEIVATIESIFGCKGVYTIEEKGGSYEINTDKIGLHIDAIGILFDKEYTSKIIRKYFIDE